MNGDKECNVNDKESGERVKKTVEKESVRERESANNVR